MQAAAKLGFFHSFADSLEKAVHLQDCTRNCPFKTLSGFLPSEIITILIAFHQSGMSCFKFFYLDEVVREEFTDFIKQIDKDYY